MPKFFLNTKNWEEQDMSRTAKFSFSGIAAILLCTAFFVFNSLTVSAVPAITFNSDTGTLTISGDGEVTEAQ